MGGGEWARFVVVPAMLAMASAGSAMAQDYKARAWAASCAACHGTEGRSDTEYPALAGKPKDELLKSMLEFKADKKQPSTVMHQHMKGYTEQELERIAEYYSKQKK